MNLDKMGKFLVRQKLLKWTQRNSENKKKKERKKNKNPPRLSGFTDKILSHI